MSTCPSLGPEHCYPEGKQLVMIEKWIPHCGVSQIKDIDGNVVFKSDNSLCGHAVHDACDKLIYKVQKKWWGQCRQTFHIYGGYELNERRATMNFRIRMGRRKKAHVYIYQAPFLTPDDGTDLDGMQPALKMESTGWGLSEFRIYNAATGEVYADGGRAEAARVMGKASCKTMVVNVKPGVDAAFMVMIILFFNNCQKNE